MLVTKNPEQTQAPRRRLSINNHLTAGGRKAGSSSSVDINLLPSESPPAVLELTHGAQEIHLAEGGPKDIGKIELAVGALP